MTMLSKDEIRDMIERFTEGFNNDELDDVMAFFTEDAVYVEFTGKVNREKKEIRKALEPQFRGDFGAVRFHDKDFVIDENAQSAVFNWWCIMSLGDKFLRWEGLDLFKFENGLIKEKRTFAQADLPRFMPRNFLLIPKFLVHAAGRKVRNLLF